MKTIFSKNRMAGATPNYKPGAFISSEEISVYRALCEVSGAHNKVLVKVNLAELVAMPGPDRHYLAHWRRVQCLTLDYLICSTSMLRPFLAIKMGTELDSKRRQASGSDILEDVLKDIGLPLLRLTVHETYEAKDLAGQISVTLQKALRTRSVHPSDTERLKAKARVA